MILGRPSSSGETITRRENGRFSLSIPNLLSSSLLDWRKSPFGSFFSFHTLTDFTWVGTWERKVHAIVEILSSGLWKMSIFFHPSRYRRVNAKDWWSSGATYWLHRFLHAMWNVLGSYVKRKGRCITCIVIGQHCFEDIGEVHCTSSVIAQMSTCTYRYCATYALLFLALYSWEKTIIISL